MNSITDSKDLWRTTKPFLSDSQTKVSLAEKSKLLSNETKIIETSSN